jgi:hypothetical protein
MTVTFDSDYLHDLWLLRALSGFSGYGTATSVALSEDIESHLIASSWTLRVD